MAPVFVVSLALQIGLFLANPYFPTAHPKKIQSFISRSLGVVALVCTASKVSLLGLYLSLGQGVLVASLLTFALIPPLVGCLEARYRSRGQEVYSTEASPGHGNRFPGHVLTNMLGAAATCALVWAALSTSGFDEFIVHFADDVAFNIMLPLAGLIAFAFVRWQQVDRCPDIDERIAADASQERAIVGYSLRHLHQLTNVLFLVVVNFTAGATMLYLFAHTIIRAKQGDPLAMTWQVVVTVVLALLFFLACGCPRLEEALLYG